MAKTASSRTAAVAGAQQVADAIERSPFARVTELLASHQPGKPLINLSLGEPQHPVPDFVGPVLAKAVAGFGRYPIAKGTEPFRQAAAAWVSKRFALPRAVDPDSELHGPRRRMLFGNLH